MNSTAPPLLEAVRTQHCDWGPHYSKKKVWQGHTMLKADHYFLLNILSFAQLRATFWHIKQCREGHMTWMLFFIDSELRATIFKVIHLGTTGATWIQEHHYCWKQLPSIVIGGHIKVKKKSDRGHTMLKADHYFIKYFRFVQLRATFWYIKQCREGHMTWMIFYRLRIEGHYFQSDPLGHHGATWIQEHHHCWKQIPSIVIEGHIIVKKKSDRGHTMLKSDHYFYWIFSILHS